MNKILRHPHAALLAFLCSANACFATTIQVQGFVCDNGEGGATAKFVHVGKTFPLSVKISNPSNLAGAVFPQGVSGLTATSLSYKITPVSPQGTVYPVLRYTYKGVPTDVSLGFTSFSQLPKQGKVLNYDMQALGVPKGSVINDLAIYISEYSGDADAYLDNFVVDGIPVTTKVLKTAACPVF